MEYLKLHSLEDTKPLDIKGTALIDVVVNSWSDRMLGAVKQALSSVTEDEVEAVVEADYPDGTTYRLKPSWRHKLDIKDLLFVAATYTAKAFVMAGFEVDESLLFQEGMVDKVIDSELSHIDLRCFTAISKTACADTPEEILAFIGLTMFLFALYVVKHQLISYPINHLHN